MRVFVCCIIVHLAVGYLIFGSVFQLTAVPARFADEQAELILSHTKEKKRRHLLKRSDSTIQQVSTFVYRYWSSSIA